ncbi:MAG: sulfotransferase [Actinomycetota bacterium]
MTGQLPTLYIIGAPKCGTTSLAQYVSEHPHAFVGYPKEPSYWSTDIGSTGSVAVVDSEDAYRRIYRRALDGQVCLDASTDYLRSRVAIPRICAAVPDARFIVALRNPVDIAHAYHMEMIFNSVENESDFRAAWELQPVRATGRRLPAGATDPNELQYRSIASIGSQLARASELIPNDRLLVVFHDDLQQRPRTVWEEIQDFAELPRDGRLSFPAEGSSHFHRFPTIAGLYQTPPPILAAPVRAGKRLVRAQRSGVVNRTVTRLLVRRSAREPLDPDFAARLRHEFDAEVSLVESLTGRDLSSWRTAS